MSASCWMLSWRSASSTSISGRSRSWTEVTTTGSFLGQGVEFEGCAVPPRGHLACALSVPPTVGVAHEGGAFVDAGDDQAAGRELQRAVLLLLRPGVVVRDHGHALEQSEPERERPAPGIDH